MYSLKGKVLSALVNAPRSIRLQHKGAVKSFDEIPGPISFPVFGTMLHYMPWIGPYDFRKLPETYAKMHQQYGDVVREDCNKYRTIVHVYHPDDMYTVYNSDGVNPRRLSHTALGKYRLARPHLYDGQGLISSNGEEWLRYRNMFKRAFINPQTVMNVSNALEEVSQDLVETIPYRLDENLEMDLSPLLYRWGLETVGYIALDVRLRCLSLQGNAEAATLIQAAEDTHLAVYATESTPLNYDKNYRMLERAQDVLARSVENYMDEFLKRKDWQQRNCLLTTLMKCEGASKKDVFTMLVDLFLAGIDTTSFTVSFALYNLALHPDIQSKLRQELMQCIPDPNGHILDYNRLPRYLRAVFKESTRTNPIAIGNGRLLNEDVVLGGYHVPKDTMVILQHQAASVDERFYKDAKSFIPERWFDKNSRTIASSPFGFGFRTCVGSLIAEREVLIAISKLVRNYELSYHHGPIGTKTLLLNFPDKPLKLRLKRITQ